MNSVQSCESKIIVCLVSTLQEKNYFADFADLNKSETYRYIKYSKYSIPYIDVQDQMICMERINQYEKKLAQPSLIKLVSSDCGPVRTVS